VFTSDVTNSGQEPTFSANSLQTAMWAHMQCRQSLEGLPIRNKSGSPSIQTHSVRFIGGYPGIKDRGKVSFSADTGEPLRANMATADSVG
jgi:hypothetical protein